MNFGTTSFSFRTLLRDAARAPSLATLIEETHALGLASLQLCENARPLELSARAWERLLQQGADSGVELQLGCKTLAEDVLDQHLNRAAAMPARLLRVVLEEEHGAPPSRAYIDDFLAATVPKLERLGVQLAIENHFDVPSKLLTEVAARYPSPLLGFCVDSANSLRSFEPMAYVFEQLQPRAFCYHVKDFKVIGNHLGFTVTGAPLGAGDLPLDDLLARVFARETAPALFIENWVTASGDWETDVRAEAAWLRTSIQNLRARLQAFAATAAI